MAGVRYKLMAVACQSLGIPWLFTAHHSDDQALILPKPTMLFFQLPFVEASTLRIGQAERGVMPMKYIKMIVFEAHQ